MRNPQIQVRDPFLPEIILLRATSQNFIKNLLSLLNEGVFIAFDVHGACGCKLLEEAKVRGFELRGGVTNVHAKLGYEERPTCWTWLRGMNCVQNETARREPRVTPGNEV